MITKQKVYSQYSSLEIIIYFLIFGAIAVWKTPQIFVDPRLWAEEGSVFYAYCRSSSVLGCLSFVHLGYYQLLENIFVFLAAKVPILYAPAITTYSTLLLHMIVVYQLAIFARGYSLSRICTALLAAAWALLPQTYEVWMSATNSQWVIGVSTLLILATPTFLLENRPKTLVTWAAVCGLSGPPGVLLTPLLFVRALWEKSRLLLLVAIVVGLCAIVQLIVFETNFRHGVEERRFVHTAWLLISPMILQTIIAPLFSYNIMTLLQTILADPNQTRIVFFSLLIGGVNIFFIVLAMAWSSQKHSVSLFIAMAWILVSLVQTFGALGNPPGARYFLFGSTCLCLLLALGTKATSRAVAVSAAATLGSIVLVGAVEAQLAAWPQSMRTGPSWRDQVEACPPRSTCHIAIWPAGWSLEIAK